MFGKPGLKEIIDLDQEFLNAIVDIERKIEFTQIEKCEIETTKGKKIVRRGVLIPQAMEKKLKDT